MMTFSSLYNDGRNNYQSDFRTIKEWRDWCNTQDDLRWAVLVRVNTGLPVAHIVTERNK